MKKKSKQKRLVYVVLDWTSIAVNVAKLVNLVIDIIDKATNYGRKVS